MIVEIQNSKGIEELEMHLS